MREARKTAHPLPPGKRKPGSPTPRTRMKVDADMHAGGRNNKVAQ
jgi:hypothetical protein